MYKIVVASLVLILAVVLILPSSHSVVPSLINYQGLIKDNVGDPIDGTYALTFRIFNSAAGGTQLWSETHPSVTVTKGLFNVVLGSQGGGLTQNIFAGSSAWLEILVESDTLSPRTQFTTSAYSHRVTTVDGATAGEVTGDLVVGGKVKASAAIEPYGGIILPSGITIQSTAGNVVVLAGASVITVSPSGGVTIQGSTVEINSTNELILSAANKVAIASDWIDFQGDSLTSVTNSQTRTVAGTGYSVQAGTNINLSSGIQTLMNSGNITNITASTTLDLNGALVQIN